ncbi:PilW family protein [Vibrio ulleungensis]|uniref:Type II secretion system protein n=1 Tax=Vibrio ulleungensis TaxID=2807619 RepID=A0ABS2HKK3_9VIBR|nr:type II secretion system protein [Vibrio ulleungensis]MBM7038025.1 type II secretion system protein [Vibrio ulleungensis]
MRRNGFTLIEMIITITVVSVLFLAIAGFVEFGARGYVDSADRQRLQNQARFALEKMTREFRHAVPNSFETTSLNKCLSFYPIKYTGFYIEQLDLDDPENPILTLEFVLGNDGISYPLTFDDKDFMVINPSRIEDLESGSPQRLSLKDESIAIDSTGEVLSTVESHSIGRRHFVFNEDNKVTYCISGSLLTRETSSEGTVTVAEYVNSTDSSFAYEQASLQRGGLIHMNFVFNLGDEVSEYQHDVQVMNVQ